MYPVRRSASHVALLVIGALGLASCPLARAADCNRNGLQDRLEIAADPRPTSTRTATPTSRRPSPCCGTRGTAPSLLRWPSPTGSTPTWCTGPTSTRTATPTSCEADARGGVAVVWNLGGGRFSAEEGLVEDISTVVLSSADLDQDGDTDLVVGSSGGGSPSTGTRAPAGSLASSGSTCPERRAVPAASFPRTGCSFRITRPHGRLR